MNLTHVVPYMHPHAGGPPVVVDRLCRRLAARGHRVRVVTTDALSDGAPGWEREYANAGYELEVHRARGNGPFAYSPTFAGAVRAAVASSDLVHLHTAWTYPTLRAAWACRSRGVPYLVMPHGMLDPHSMGRKRLKKWAYAKLFEGPNLRRAAGLVCTHAEEDRLARQSFSGLPRGWVVPLAADEPPPEPREALAEEFLARHGNFRGTKIVLFLGRLHPKKGLDLLLPAFADLVKRVPEARLALVGPGDASYVRGLHETIAANGTAEYVKFLGPLSGRDKWAALSAATLFALPSYQENFAITVVEALSVGTPVMISRRINIAEDIEKAGSGVIANLDTPSISASMAEVVSSAERTERLGSAGRELVRRTYNWDRTADAAELAYRAVLLPNATPVEPSGR